MTHGGKRTGAGRPSKAGTPRSFRLSARACKLLDGYAWRWGRTQAEVIDIALGTLESIQGLVENDPAANGRGESSESEQARKGGKK